MSQREGGGTKTLPGLCSKSVLKTLLAYKTCLYVLGRIAYIFNRGLMPPKLIS